MFRSLQSLIYWRVDGELFCEQPFLDRAVSDQWSKTDDSKLTGASSWSINRSLATCTAYPWKPFACLTLPGCDEKLLFPQTTVYHKFKWLVGLIPGEFVFIVGMALFYPFHLPTALQYNDALLLLTKFLASKQITPLKSKETVFENCGWPVLGDRTIANCYSWLYYWMISWRPGRPQNWGWLSALYSRTPFQTAIVCSTKEKLFPYSSAYAHRTCIRWYRKSVHIVSLIWHCAWYGCAEIANPRRPSQYYCNAASQRIAVEAIISLLPIASNTTPTLLYNHKSGTTGTNAALPA